MSDSHVDPDAVPTEPELHHAVREEALERVKALLDSGTNVNSRSGDNHTALHVAALTGNFEAAGLLLEVGAEVDALTGDAKTPLHLACVGRQGFEMIWPDPGGTGLCT